MSASFCSRRKVLTGLGATALILAAGPAAAASLQSEAARYLNAYRARAGLGALSANGLLVSAAETQCAIMIQHGKIGHSFGPGTTFSERMRQAGLGPGLHAENVAHGQENIASVMQAWMNSPGHRRNMLHPRMSVFGLGRKMANGRPYWALVLAG